MKTWQSLVFIFLLAVFVTVYSLNVFSEICPFLARENGTKAVAKYFTGEFEDNLVLIDKYSGNSWLLIRDGEGFVEWREIYYMVGEIGEPTPKQLRDRIDSFVAQNTRGAEGKANQQ